MKNQNSKYNWLIAMGVAFVLAGTFMIALQLIEASIASAILSFGITMLIIAIFRKIRKKTMPEKDERIKKLSMYGLGYSWITTFLLITIMFWLDYFNLLNITTQQYYHIIFVTMILSAVIFQKILYRKGDAE